VSLFRRLSLPLRKRLPQRVRFALRLVNHLFFHRSRASLPLSQELVSDCRVCASRWDLLKFLPHHGQIAEVGTHRGDFARQILDVCNPQELRLVDLDASFLASAIENDPRVRVFRGFSHEILTTFPDAYFDWIYIDADHSYEAVTRDAQAAASKVKRGGYLVFNDFAHTGPNLGAFGVHRAVIDFATTHGWRFAWFAFEPNALYDVALKRQSD
jgi:hypothetical protein